LSAHVFLTGATGFLGSSIARLLAERGRVLHALVRPGAELGLLRSLGAHFHSGDLRDAGSLERGLEAAIALSGASPLDVVHGAAVISYRTRDAALQREVNVEGTRRLLDACRRHPIRRVLHLSSVVAIGWSEDGRPITEEHSWNGDRLRVDYVTTKRRAEELALEASAELDLVVVNPGAVFGPAGPRSNSAALLHAAAAGRVRCAPPGAFSLVGVEDVARGCELALERGRRGRRYLLTESSLSASELLAALARALGRPRRFPSVPGPLWRSLELAVAGVDRLRPLDRLTPQALRMLRTSFASDAARARDELGWRPRPLAQVLEQALEALGLQNQGGGDP
jgi:dihydroflavonol-4-reductase